MRHTLCALVVMTVTSPVAFADEWAGKDVFPRKANVNLRAADKSEVVGIWELYDARVLRVNGEWLEVRLTQIAEVNQGWVKTSEVVKAEDAVAYFTDYLKKNENDTWGYTNRATAYTLKSDFANAIKDLTAVIDLEPDDPTNYENRGDAYRQNKDYDKAIKDFDAAIKLDPKNTYPYISRGITWAEKEDYDKAMKDFETAIKLDPKNSLAFYHRGKTWSQQGEYDKAIKDFTQAIKLDPNDIDAFIQRGHAWDEENEPDKAIADYTQALKLDPTRSEAFDSRGLLWNEKGEYAKAIADFTQAIKLDPKDPAYSENLAWIHATCPDAKFRNGRKAVELATKACELTKWKDGFYLDTLAAAHAEAGNFVKAIEYQKKALEDKTFAKENADGAKERLKLYEQRMPFREAPPEK
ncbi:MAG: tetratricopeptide repeat protein [Planctomycetia bacterium]|nr:tetratricopeptide repeat protein [Planctomycetia bacterium]